MSRIVISVAAFLLFTIYTASVAINHSVFGFLADHALGGWSLQIFLDLVMAAICFWIVAIPDARTRGINFWPYVVLTPLLGSIALLAYFVHRSVRQHQGG